MSKRNRRPDPGDPAQWLSQLYTPHDPYYYLTGRGRFLHAPFAWAASRGAVSYGCLLAGLIVLAWAGLFAIALISESGLNPLLAGGLVLVAGAIVIVGVLSARRLRHARKAHRHHKHHAAHYEH